MQRFIQSLLLTAAIAVAGHKSVAACLPPTTANISLTNITCAGSGVVTVNTVTDGVNGVVTDLSYYRFSLYKAADGAPVKPEQPSPVLSGLDSGTYVLHIRQVCLPSGMSADYTQTVRLTGFYTKPVMGVPVVTAPTCSNNGIITAVASSGSGTYEYCLVDSMNAPLSPTHFVSPRQASSSITSLAPGDYYLRVYDQCTGFVTTKVTVPAGIPASSPISGLKVSDESCDNLSITTSFTRNVPLSANLIWWVLPNGSTDTLKTSTSPGSQTTYLLPKSAIPAYPATITMYYTNECGVLFNKALVIQQPKYKFSVITTASGYNCTQGTYSLNNAYLLDSANGNLPLLYKWEGYSTDSGLTWKTYRSTDTILVNKGSSRILLFKMCGITYSAPITMPGGLSALNISLFGITGMHCDGKAGIGWNLMAYNGKFTDILVHVVSQPATQAPIADFYLQAQMISKYTMNLAPGSYTLQFTDGCGATTTKTISITVDKSAMSAWPVLNCGSSKVGIAFKNDAVRNVPSSLGYEIKDNKGNTVSRAQLYGAYADTIFNLNPGVYNVKLWLVDYENQMSTDTVCHQEFTIDASLPQPLALDRSLFAVCTNAPASGAIIALPVGGMPAYAYSLYKDSVSATKLVAGPQSSNVFNGLSSGDKFYIAVTDKCGSGATYTQAFQNVKPVVTPSIPYVPCVGTAITLTTQKISGALYQWTKDGVAIPGATDTLYAIKPMTMAAGGTYELAANAGNCIMLSNPMQLDPASCGNIIPLPLELLHFNGMLNAQSNAVLRWDIGTPEVGARFEVLYSSNGNDFNTAGVVAQDGQTMSFSFVHQQYTVTAKTFYKLKLVLANGQALFSHVLVLQGNGSNGSDNTISISPVPFSSSLNISYTAQQDAKVQVSITDVSGRNIRSVESSVLAGTNNIGITDLESLPQGVYILRVTDNNGNSQSVKIQK